MQVTPWYLLGFVMFCQGSGSLLGGGTGSGLFGASSGAGAPYNECELRI